MQTNPPPQMTLELMSTRLKPKEASRARAPGASLIHVLDAMRSQGAVIGAPQSARFAAPPHHTAWTITICVKDARADLLFFVPDDLSIRSNV